MEIGNLKVTMPSECEIAFTRTFDAPRERVFAAFTNPEKLKQWFYGPSGWSLAVAEMDLRPGGAYRFVWRKDGGKEMGMGGVYREVAAPERFVATEKFDEPWYAGEALGTFAFAESDGRTTLTQTMRYESRETRDAVMATPAAQGAAAAYDRLAESL
jgi:uncharacterized protein YndB with AHSA1/START domain